jgi:multidrug efflux pump subunit AcrB
MSNILGVKHVYSVSDKGQGIVTIEFDVGQEMTTSVVKVRDKMLANLDFMPPGARTPLVKPKEIDDVSIVNLTLWSKSLDDGQLRSLGLELLQQLGKVPNTNNGFVVGGRKEIFHIDIFPGRLAGYGISIQQISNTIGSANVSSHTGNIELNVLAPGGIKSRFANILSRTLTTEVVISCPTSNPLSVLKSFSDIFFSLSFAVCK